MPRTARARAPVEAKQTAVAPSIAAFTRVSKSHAFPDATAKRAMTSAGELKTTTTTTTTTTTRTPSKKRKASLLLDNDAGAHTRRNISFSPSDEDGDQEEEREERQQTSTTRRHVDASQRKKRACRRQEPVLTTKVDNTPVKAATKAASPTAVVTKGKVVAKTPTARKHAAHRPAAATIISKSRQEAKTGQTRIDALFTKQQARSTADKDEIDAAFPPNMAELVRLHRAFLKTVVMQMAHTRSNVPLDIRELAPNISRSWRKRQVTVEDVRRCVAMESSARDDGVRSPFIVADYGRGKVCVELRAGYDGGAINETQLCRQFEDNLKTFCTEKATDQMADVDVTLESLSLAELPQADLTDMNTGVKTAALLAKGHKALSELKSGMAAKQQEKDAKQQAAAATPLLNPDGTKMSLLDRLRHKQLAAANAPLPPTGPELQRRAALSRVVDVASTISMLSLSNPVSLPRQAFTMVAIVEKLRDSLRVPMSKEEGTECIRLIAKEVAPDWLRIVAIGGRENVVIQRGGEPVSRVIQERVQKLM
ncbi:DNA mismatch repair protein msh-2 [Cordyceps javanica]|uniref:DNA mismatch repair protein msh-2 n=1 Tax=Cordyceps javanica TaxID=43265 RepID=A0A545VEY9_9HYPO|nr:DNA mismatch repair protein msh-2 [Cordyceps javanica]TQW11474.1 DNA mismatch repair protein msh-2 [Cordyceps javanica]